MLYLTRDVITAVGFRKPAGYLETNSELRFIIYQRTPCAGRGVGRFLGYIKDLVDERYNDLETNHTDILQSFIHPEYYFLFVDHPSSIRALQSEIDSAGKKVTSPVIRDAEAKALPYLQACIKDGLRTFPPSMGLMGKVCPRDDTICGIEVPANTQVAWSALAIMRNRTNFGEDADLSEPQCWLDATLEKRKEMDASDGLVFATGTRWECLGKRLAYIELRKLFRRFDFAMVDRDVPFRWANHGLTAHFGMNVRITRREAEGDVEVC
ncbi:cytochrome P450 [Aspergillus foveolatus]|uniref:cytochrome P450 n=1 Tax=Aspergillus foveolatus TaxID=210207 RepID=UPI003CCE216E